jgi:hypothetical protein
MLELRETMTQHNMYAKRVTFHKDVVDPLPATKCSSCPYRKFRAFSVEIILCTLCQKLFCDNCMYAEFHCKPCYQHKPVIITGCQLFFNGEMLYLEE